jgi:uncharacterized membrane protein HdeD (DUF308 family)
MSGTFFRNRIGSFLGGTLAEIVKTGYCSSCDLPLGGNERPMSNGTSVEQGGASSIIWGILMLICGILAIALPLASGIGVAIVIGWLILFSAVWHLIFAFRSRGVGGVLWQLLLAILYGAAGIFIVINPVVGLASLTLVLAVFLLIEAGLEIGLYFSIRHLAGAGWVLFDGIITFILGLLVWIQWPVSSAWFLGTLVGISLIFSGISRLMLAGAVHRRAHSPARAAA